MRAHGSDLPGSELDGTNLEVYVKRATAYMVSGKTDLARRDLDKVLAEEPQHLKALLKRARVRRSMGQFDEAVVDYEAAKKIEPDNKKIAKELPQVGQAKAAQDAGRKVFEQAKAAREKGDAANAKRLYQSAHHSLGTALKAAPDAPESLLMDSEAMLHIGGADNWADVIQTTGRLLKIRPVSRHLSDREDSELAATCPRVLGWCVVPVPVHLCARVCAAALGPHFCSRAAVCLCSAGLAGRLLAAGAGVPLPG
eukprot:SAG22_NODE_3221_length_1847_cov_1.870709_1_plen_254_part_00